MPKKLPLDELDEKARRVATAIRQYSEKHQGIVPTVREIQRMSGIPLATVQHRMGMLESLGCLGGKEAGKQRHYILRTTALEAQLRRQRGGKHQ